MLFLVARRRREELAMRRAFAAFVHLTCATRRALAKELRRHRWKTAVYVGDKASVYLGAAQLFVCFRFWAQMPRASRTQRVPMPTEAPPPAPRVGLPPGLVLPARGVASREDSAV